MLRTKEDTMHLYDYFAIQSFHSGKSSAGGWL